MSKSTRTTKRMPVGSAKGTASGKDGKPPLATHGTAPGRGAPACATHGSAPDKTIPKSVLFGK